MQKNDLSLDTCYSFLSTVTTSENENLNMRMIKLISQVIQTARPSLLAIEKKKLSEYNN